MEGQKRNKKVCVLGAGISGICQALAREEKGEDVTVFEKQSQVGGVLKSKIIQGYLLDYGANTLSLRSKKIKKKSKKSQKFRKNPNISEKLNISEISAQ